jgi:hypothetical protein
MESQNYNEQIKKKFFSKDGKPLFVKAVPQIVKDPYKPDGRANNRPPPPRMTIKKPKIVDAHRQIFQNYKDQGFRNLGKAIRKTAVYSPHVEKRVGHITHTKSWQLLMQEYMPEEHLAKRHAELLDKREYRKVTDEQGQSVEVDNGPETAAVTKGLELAYRLRGSFQKEEALAPSTVMYNLFYKPEVREQMRVFEDGIKQSLLHEINKRNLADIETEEENQSNLNGSGPPELEAEPEQPAVDNGGGSESESGGGVSGGGDGGGVPDIRQGGE